MRAARRVWQVGLLRAFTGENGQQPPLPADDARFLIGDAPAVVHYQTIDPLG